MTTKQQQKELGKTLWGIANELRGAETEKIEALKEHKKGLMQQLFPQN